MAYGDEVCRICKIANGYEVELRKPPKKEKSSKGAAIAMEYEWETYALSDLAAVMAFMQKNKARLGEKQTRAEEYDEAFKEAAAA